MEPIPMKDLRARCEERMEKIVDSGDIGHFAKMYVEDVRALLAEYDPVNVTALQERGTQLISDQRDLKKLVKRALNGEASLSTWALEAQALLERMK